MTLIQITKIHEHQIFSTLKDLKSRLFLDLSVNGRERLTKAAHLWRDGLQPGAVLVALVVDEAQLAEEHGEHAEVLLELPQPVLVGVGVVRDSIRQLRRRAESNHAKD